MSETATGDTVAEKPKKTRSKPKAASQAGSDKDTTRTARAKKKPTAGSKKHGPADKTIATGSGKRQTGTKRKSTTRAAETGKKKPKARKRSGLGPAALTRSKASDIEAASADDPKSIAWMAAQAVNALNAVKASQAEKAEALLARADIQEDGNSDSPLQPPAQASDEAAGMAALTATTELTPAGTAAPGEPCSTPVGQDLPPKSGAAIEAEGPVPPAPPGDTLTDLQPTDTLETALTGQDSLAPGKETNTTVTRAAEVEPAASMVAVTVPEETAPSGNEEPSSQADSRTQVQAPPPVRPAPAGQRGPLGTVLLVGVVVIAALFGYQYWSGDSDSDALQEAPAASPGKQAFPGSDAPPDRPVTAVAREPVHSGNTAATDTSVMQPAVDTAPLEPTAITPSIPEPETAAPMAPVQQDKAPPVTGPATADPAESITATADKVPEQAEPAPVRQPVTRQAPTQPRYRAPGYGYQRQQPAWQQPYYPQGAPQYPSR
jgi:hypothetical protein